MTTNNPITLDDLVVSEPFDDANALHRAKIVAERCGVKFVQVIICEGCGDIRSDVPTGWSQYDASRYGNLVKSGLASWCQGCWAKRDSARFVAKKTETPK